jgi:lysophospholipase L1-like esterase
MIMNMNQHLKRIAAKLRRRDAKPTRTGRHLRSVEWRVSGKRVARRRPMHVALLLSAGALAGCAPASAQSLAAKTAGRLIAPVNDARWREAFEAFAQADRQRFPATGGVVFVGSSSIRLWDGLETQFGDGMPIVKRGFGGSRLHDVAQYVDRLVLPYKPKLVVVYAGDNDLAEGRSPEDVLHSFERFVDGVRKELPDTRIAYLSIKPSPLREDRMPAARTANRLIADYAATQPGISYIDIYSGMLDSDGRPRRELFLPDALHLNAAGYALWKAALQPHLSQVAALVKPIASAARGQVK